MFKELLYPCNNLVKPHTNDLKEFFYRHDPCTKANTICDSCKTREKIKSLTLTIKSVIWNSGLCSASEGDKLAEDIAEELMRNT